MHDAAFDAAGIDARYVLLELEPDAVEAAVGAARGPDWLGLGVTAPYKRVVAGLCDTVEADAVTIGAVNNVVRTPTVGSSASTPTRPGSGPGSSWRWAGRWPAPRSSSPGPAVPPTRSCSPASAAGARRVTVGNRTAAAATRWSSGSARVGSGAPTAVVAGSPAFEAALAVGGPGRQRDDRRHGRPGHDDPGRPPAGRRRRSSTSSTSRPRRRCSRRPGRAACGRPTVRRCSSRRRRSRSSAGPASAAWPT